MPKFDFHASCMLQEAHATTPSGIPEPRCLSPLNDPMAAVVGHIQVSWGQMMDSMLRYTKCLIAHNQSPPIASKWLDYPQLRTRFSEETDKAFTGMKTAKTIAADAVTRANRAHPIRKCLAHDALSWASENGLPVVVATYPTKKHTTRTTVLRLGRLEVIRQDIEISHGRIHQLALSNVVPVPYTSLEKSTLQAIQSKGWTPHPIIGKR